ncbi:hypothetical protein Tco_1448618 [Tanacetum coccineum]
MTSMAGIREIRNMEMEPDIENMTMSEYLEYEAAKERRLWDDDSICKHDDDLEDDQEEDGDDKDSFDMWDITVEDVEQIGKFLTPNVLEIIEDVIQPLIPKTLYTTPPNEDYVPPATKSILDELLEEFRDKILNVTMVDEGADFNPNKDIKELEKLLANDPKQHYMEIQGSNSKGMEFELLQDDAHGGVLG